MAGFRFKSLGWAKNAGEENAVGPRLSRYVFEISGGKRVRNSKSCHKARVFTSRCVEYTFVSSGFIQRDTFRAWERCYLPG